MHVRYSSICIAGAIALSTWHAAAAAESSPSTVDRHAYSVGQSYARTFQDVLMPGTCGIVLERQRCRDDFAAVKKSVGAGKMDDQVAQWLTNGDLDHRVRDWQGSEIPDTTWQNDPSFGWWFCAGVLSISVDMPKNAGTTAFVSSIVDDLAKHEVAAPPQFSKLIDSGGSPDDRAKRLVDALETAIPPTAFPAVSLSAGDTGYAQLGVLSSTVQELVDNPLALSRPESRLFALAVVDRIETFDRKLGGSYSFDDIRQRLRGDIPTENEQVDSELRQPWIGWVSQLNKSPDERDALLLGSMTAQAAYNAAILKDQDADAGPLRGFISKTKPYAGMSTAAETAVLKMQNVPFGDWSNINTTASAATLAIMLP